MTEQLLTVAQVAERTGLTAKAVRRRCEKGQIDHYSDGPGSQRLIPASEVDRILEKLADKGIKQKVEAQAPKTVMGKDEAMVVGDVGGEISNPDSLLRERGLDPEEWEITHLKVNEWDGPFGEPCKQLTVNLRRKVLSLFNPGVIDDYVAPKKGKPVTKGAKLVVFVGDQQAPHHDPQLHRQFCDWLRANNPHEGILMGDTVDFPNISRHAPNPEWDNSVQECINSGYLMLRDYVQSSEDTYWTKLVGNHDERIRTRLINLMTNLYGVRRADIPGQDEEPSAFCVSNLLRLKELGIAYVDPQGGYAHAQTKVSRHLAARHGWVAKKGSGASALSTLEHLGYSVVVGHTHRQGIVHKTSHDIDGTLSTLAAAETGCMCQIKDGLGYTVAPDWQNGFATAMVWADGTFKLDLATYANGTLYWRDQRYK